MRFLDTDKQLIVQALRHYRQTSPARRPCPLGVRNHLVLPPALPPDPGKADDQTADADHQANALGIVAEKVSSVLAVVERQEPFTKVPNPTPDADRDDEIQGTNLGHAGSQHEDF